MKRLLTVLCLLASLSVFGQGARCIVRNNTNCTIFYVLVMSVPSGTPTCTFGANSTVVSIAPGAMITWTAPSVPGMPAAARYFLAARVLYGPPSCSPPNSVMGETACGYPAGPIPFVARDASCAACSNVVASWTPSSPAGATSLINFN